MVQKIESEGAWAALMEQSKEKLVVVDFTATWCGPCQMVAAPFAAMSQEFTNAVFAKVDVDQMDEIAQRVGVQAMPTFHFYKNGEKVDEVIGANLASIKSKIAALA